MACPEVGHDLTRPLGDAITCTILNGRLPQHIIFLNAALQTWSWHPLSMWRGTILDLFRGLIWLAAQGLHDPFQTLALFKPC